MLSYLFQGVTMASSSTPQPSSRRVIANSTSPAELSSSPTPQIISGYIPSSPPQVEDHLLSSTPFIPFHLAEGGLVFPCSIANHNEQLFGSISPPRRRHSGSGSVVSVATSLPYLEEKIWKLEQEILKLKEMVLALQEVVIELSDKRDVIGTPAYWKVTGKAA